MLDVSVMGHYPLTMNTYQASCDRLVSELRLSADLRRRELARILRSQASAQRRGERQR